MTRILVLRGRLVILTARGPIHLALPRLGR